jgi:Uma2 family endonuclease
MSEHAGHLVSRRPDPSQLITEDDEPVDNIQSEKAQRLLVGALYASWSGPPVRPVEQGGTGEPRRFFAASNVGLFHHVQEPPVVPDVLVSTDVAIDVQDYGPDALRSYFIWELGKVPEVVIELVSNERGAELGKKLHHYARLHISYYVVFDPFHVLGESALRLFELRGDTLQPVLVRPDQEVRFSELALGLKVWEGAFEGTVGRWLRFTDGEGHLLLTGTERAEAERTRAEAERTRAEAERTRAEAERTRAEAERTRADRLAERLRALGLDPDEPAR